MDDTIKITHGNGVVTLLPAKQISGTSFVRGGDLFHFLVYERCGNRAWKISQFSSKQAADEQRHHIEREYSRIMSR